MEEFQVIWGWQPALYLFLGGMGAGAFIAAMVLHLRDGANHRRLVGASILAAVVCLIVGLLLLLSELISPLRGMMMWQSFSNTASWMTFGAWVVFAAVVVFLATWLCVSDGAARIIGGAWKGFDAVRDRLARVLGIIGMVLGAAVAVYTGILLMSAPGVPLWNTALIPCLFTVSALDTGIALVEVIAFALKGREPLGHALTRMLEIGVVVLVVVELLVLAFLLVGMAAGNTVDAFIATDAAATAKASGALIVFGGLAVPFWLLVVACGLLVPLAAAVLALVRSESPAAVALVGAAGALIGGCALRFIIVMAGVHADPVMDAVARIIG